MYILFQDNHRIELCKHMILLLYVNVILFHKVENVSSKIYYIQQRYTKLILFNL